MRQTSEGVMAQNVCIADDFPDETHVQDVSISGVDGDSYIIQWREKDAVKENAVSLGAADEAEYTDVDVQLSFSDNIKIPSSIVVFLMPLTGQMSLMATRSNIKSTMNAWPFLVIQSGTGNLKTFHASMALSIRCQQSRR